MIGPGFTIWLTGLSGAGKSTLARSIGQYLEEYDYPVEVLDGEVMRASLSVGLGFSREDRDTNGRRIAYLCNLLTRNGSSALQLLSPPIAKRGHGHGTKLAVSPKCM